MKTLNLKRLACIVAVMTTVIAAMAETPSKVYNDQVIDGRIAVREVCTKNDEGCYERSLRCEMEYASDGSLASKNVYNWNQETRSWVLYKSYFYSPIGIELITYNGDGTPSVIESLYAHHQAGHDEMEQ